MGLYFFCLGSSASVNASPIKLKTVTVIKIAHPGKTASHHADGDCRAAARSEPHVTVSGETPTPKKERVDSISIAAAIPKEIVMSTGESALGIA